MVFKAGRWQQLTMTERWFILNGLAALQARRRDAGARSVQVANINVHLDRGTSAR